MAVALRGAWARFWQLLDSESVRLFVIPFYLSLLAWGVYATAFAQPIQLVEPVMGETVYRLWTVFNIVGTSSVLVGLILRHGGSPLSAMTQPQARRDWIGLWMQFGGHVCMGLVLGAFEAAALKSAFWGQATFSVFAIAPYVLGCCFLALQCARKIRRIEQLRRRLNVVL